MSDTAEPLAITNPPEIFVYALGNVYLGATINRLIDSAAHNVSGQFRTQTVLARNMDELNTRIISVLVQQYGMSQQDAVSLVPGGVTPIMPAGGGTGGDELYLPLTGGQMQGPLLLAADPAQPLEAATAQSVPKPSTTPPGMAGTAAAGTSVAFSRGDHVHPADDSRLPRKGVTDGSDAAAGEIGEFLTAARQPGSPIAAVSNVALDLTTLILTAGDWDLQGQVGTLASSGGHIQHMQMWMSQLSATVPTIFVGGFHEVGGISTGGSEQMVLPSGRMRQSLAATTTIYLSTKVTFTGTLSAYGFISARRIR